MTLIQSPLSTHPTSCAECHVKPFCFVKKNLNQLPSVNNDSLIKRRRVLKNRSILCAKDESFKSFYVIRQGIIKSFYIEQLGKERIVHFYLPGEILGFEALYKSHYPFTLATMSDTEVCEIPADKIFYLLTNHPLLLQKFLFLMSQHIHHSFHLTCSSAEQRLVEFLVEIKNRLGYKEQKAFLLPMTRESIGHHLNLAPETITRILTKLQQQGLISINKKQITMANEDRIKNYLL